MHLFLVRFTQIPLKNIKCNQLDGCCCFCYPHYILCQRKPLGLVFICSPTKYSQYNYNKHRTSTIQLQMKYGRVFTLLIT